MVLGQEEFDDAEALAATNPDKAISIFKKFINYDDVSGTNLPYPPTAAAVAAATTTMGCHFFMRTVLAEMDLTFLTWISLIFILSLDSFWVQMRKFPGSRSSVL